MNALSRRARLGWVVNATTSGSMRLAGTVRAHGAGFDHAHSASTALLRRHMRQVRLGQATQVACAGCAADLPASKGSLDSTTAETPAACSDCGKRARQAFPINAHGAFNLELILAKYPDLKSIKDLGNRVSWPCKPKWIPLLGGKSSLRRHRARDAAQARRPRRPARAWAVNCAGIGCPALRDEDFVAARLDAQVDERTLRCMSDLTRNRLSAQRGRLELSKIFDWCGEDLRLGHRGVAPLPDLAAWHADQRADPRGDRERIRSGRVDIAFSDDD